MCWQIDPKTINLEPETVRDVLVPPSKVIRCAISNRWTPSDVSQATRSWVAARSSSALPRPLRHWRYEYWTHPFMTPWKSVTRRYDGWPARGGQRWTDKPTNVAITPDDLKSDICCRAAIIWPSADESNRAKCFLPTSVAIYFLQTQLTIIIRYHRFDKSDLHSTRCLPNETG